MNPAAPSTSLPANPEVQAEAIVPASFGDDLNRLLQQRIWLRVRRRRAWLDGLKNEEPPPFSPGFFADPDDPELERRWQSEGAGRFWEETIRRIEEQLAGPLGRPLQILGDTFGLHPAELDLLSACVVQQLDPALGPALAFLHGQGQSACVNGPLVARLFGHRSHAFWHPLANVRRWKLIHPREVGPGEATAFEADPLLLPWLEGTLVLDPALASLVRSVPARSPLPGWPVERVAHAFAHNGRPARTQRLVVIGAVGTGRATFAAAVAARLGLPCVAVETGAILDQDWDDLFLKVQRFAILGGFAVIWTGSNTGRPWPRHLTTSWIQIVTVEPGAEVTAPGWTDIRITLDPPSLEEKDALWRQCCPGFVDWTEDQRHTLTRRYQLSIGQTAAIGQLQPANAAQAIELARETTRTEVGTLGHFLACPFSWDDLVLPQPLLDSLHDLAYEAATRAEFWEHPGVRRLFPRGRGLTALFSGTPGTGKTMAAQVIAAELRMDLFRIDLARVVSKYIGETAKHLSEVFARASRMSAILLFDEADALFAKRTTVKDSHDRYANADTSYLLQLLEEFQGLALLATNKRANIDPAFHRRLRYVYEFPKPAPAERTLLWRRLAAAIHGESALAADASTLELMGREVDLSPAQIKNTLLASAFIARRRGAPVEPADVLKALERELAKEGRALDSQVRLAIP
jgi:hypothetical protein